MDNYMASTFAIAYRKGENIYCAVIEDFASIANLVITPWGYISPASWATDILITYARTIHFVDTVKDFERKAKRWNKGKNLARYRGYYFEIRYCQITGAKRNKVPNMAHDQGADCYLDKEPIECKFIKGML